VGLAPIVETGTHSKDTVIPSGARHDIYPEGFGGALAVAGATERGDNLGQRGASWFAPGRVAGQFESFLRDGGRVEVVQKAISAMVIDRRYRGASATTDSGCIAHPVDQFLVRGGQCGQDASEHDPVGHDKIVGANAARPVSVTISSFSAT